MKSKILLISLLVLAIALSGCTQPASPASADSGTSGVSSSEGNQFSQLFNEAGVKMDAANISSDKGNEYNDLTVDAYEKEAFESAISNCDIAKGYYAESVQKAQEGLVLFQQANSAASNDLERELANLSVEMVSIQIQELAIEKVICEHFAKAADYSIQENFENADEETAKVGGELERYDVLIEEYNETLAKFKIALASYEKQ